MSKSWFVDVQIYVVGSKTFGPGDLVRKVSVTLDRPASVYVHYETRGAKKLKSQIVDTDGSHDAEVILARLRPNSAYAYQVFAESGTKASKPYLGKFNVSPLHSSDEQGISFFHVKGQIGALTMVERIQGHARKLMVLDEDGVVVWYRTSYENEAVIEPADRIYRDTEFNFIRSVGKSANQPVNRLIVTDVFGNEREESATVFNWTDQNKRCRPVHHEQYLFKIPTNSIYGETIIQDEGA